MKILETIKALLAKAASTTNMHEAAAFAAKANELMEKYQIDIDSIRASDDPVGRDTSYTTKAKSRTWQSHVAAATALYYGCRVVITQNTDVQIFGRESARVTTMEMLPYFIRTVNMYAREMAAVTGWDSYKCAKQIGMEFSARLRSLAPKMERPANGVVTGKNALIRLDEIDALVEATFPKLCKKRNRVTTSELARGYASQIGLNSQMGSRRTLKIGVM